MAAPQLNFPKSVNRFITISYQSNNVINDKLQHESAKKYIAEKLVEKINILGIHSYIHGEIIIEVSNANLVPTFKKVITELEKPMTDHSPPLLYSVTLAPSSNESPPTNWIYAFGDSDMNTRFLESIKDFFPTKKKN